MSYTPLLSNNLSDYKKVQKVIETGSVQGGYILLNDIIARGSNGWQRNGRQISIKALRIFAPLNSGTTNSSVGVFYTLRTDLIGVPALEDVRLPNGSAGTAIGLATPPGAIFKGEVRGSLSSLAPNYDIMLGGGVITYYHGSNGDDIDYGKLWLGVYNHTSPNPFELIVNIYYEDASPTIQRY